MPDALCHFTQSLKSRLGSATPNRQQLQQIATELLELSSNIHWAQDQYPLAPPGHENLYDIFVDSQGGPSLYLISDGVGLGFGPHDHQAWAVIVGIQGKEYNILFNITDAEQRRVARGSDYFVGPGDSLVLEPDAIHAIDADQGEHPTYHLHLYGRPLVSLPSFKDRRYLLEDDMP